MSEFIKGSKALEDAVNAADNFEALREAALQHLAAENKIVRSTEGFGQRRIAGESEPDVSLSESAVPQDQNRCLRVLYLRGNSRFEIYGPSEQDLDLQEENLRALYARQ